MRIQAVDSIAQAPALSYSATGLPGGLSISAAGLITGTLTGRGSSTVKVTARDAGATASVSFRFAAEASLLGAYHPVAGPVHLDLAGKCLDDAGGKNTNGNKIEIWNCTGGSPQKWTYEPDVTLRIGGKCADVKGQSFLDGALVDLWPCNGGFNQQWLVGENGGLVNVNSGRCLADPGDSGTHGTSLVQEDCYGQPGEIWALS